MVGHFQEFEDEYLEMMYEFHEDEPGGIVRTGDLAAKLEVSPASATEMVQRLASRGYLEYIPYKGARLTEIGLSHGQKMKRRHRLAEVLLAILPYEGNDHETACRLEHAIDDDMEVALSRLVTEDTKDPSGREIPQPTPDIAERLSTASSLISLLDLEQNTQATIAAVFMPAGEASAMEQGGFGVGAQVVRTGQDSFSSNGQTAQLSETWMKGVFVDITNDIV
jgi:DtxR family Mn-dependent transcriptional regulator